MIILHSLVSFIEQQFSYWCKKKKNHIYTYRHGLGEILGGSDWGYGNIHSFTKRQKHNNLNRYKLIHIALHRGLHKVSCRNVLIYIHSLHLWFVNTNKKKKNSFTHTELYQKWHSLVNAIIWVLQIITFVHKKKKDCSQK